VGGQPKAMRGGVRFRCGHGSRAGRPLAKLTASTGCHHRHNVDPAVLLPAGPAVLLAYRAVLAVADDRKLVAGDAHLDQIVLGGLRPGIAGHQVVFGRAALVAVTLDRQLVIRKILQDVAELGGVGLERVDRIGT